MGSGLTHGSAATLSSVTAAQCCQIEGAPAQSCTESAVHVSANKPGWTFCPPGKYLIGMQRNADDMLTGLTKLRCCNIPHSQGVDQCTRITPNMEQAGMAQ